jgi:DHA2 family multidrug resistance protein
MVVADPPAERTRFEYKWRVALIVVIGLFLSVLDNTIVSVALPNMRKAFGTDFETITWVATSYFLAQAAVIPVTGYLSDRWGMKAVFVTGLGIFLAGSLLCAAAPNERFLIAARVVQGIGGGALMPTSFALAYRAFPRDEWGHATTIIGIPVLLAPVLGPVIGGYLTTDIQWRAIFAVNLPIGCVGFVLAVWLLAADRVTESEEGRHPFDLLGLVLSMSGFTILIYGLLQAGIHGWTSPSAVAALLLGVALILVLGAVEYRTPGPVLDVRLFRIGTFGMANALLWLVVAGFYGTLFLSPFYFESIQGTSALTAGEIMIGQGLASAVGIAVAGELYNKLGPRLLVTTGVLALAISMIGFTHLTLSTTGLSLQGWMALRGLGLGLTTIPLQNLALSVVRHRDVARASSLVNVMRQVFSAAGLAALTAYVAQNAAHHVSRITASLQAHRPSSAAQTCLAAGQATLTSCIGHQGLVMGLNDAFMLVLIVSSLGVLAALVLGHDPSLVALKTMTPDRLAEIFPHLPKLELIEVTSRMQPRWFEAGEVVVREGDAPEYFYILARGEVRVTALNGDGEERELRRMGPGDFFGEIGLLGNRPRTATVTASEASQLLLMDQATFVELVRGSAPTKDQLARVMGERLAVVP